MKILIIVFFVFLNCCADNFMSDEEIARIKTDHYGIKVYTTKAFCQAETGRTCYQIDGKNPRYHIVSGNNLVLNQTLKDAYDAEIAAQQLDATNKQTAKDAAKILIQNSKGKIKNLTKDQLDAVIEALIIHLGF